MSFTEGKMFQGVIEHHPGRLASASRMGVISPRLP
jgi:hypothetical protein